MKLVYFLVLYCSCISVNAHLGLCNETDPTTPIPGGLTKADVNDPYIKNISAFALPTINRRFDATFKIARIISAETQIVAGTLYYLRLEVCTTNSNRGEDDPSSECIQTGEVNKQLCDVQVWDRPWLPEREVTELNCTAINARRKRETIPGGLSDADVSEEGVRRAAEFALTEIDKRSNSAYKQTLVQILNAQKQDAAKVRSISFKAADLEEH
ncbi:cystatin-like isoform X1 [Schistocerca gregaria]|uniref:cystatin-like isoform X1 n=1 Tax=Schistocerca gregaria TaxID=7010 RepID=UPI00211DAEB4|nr:cystatin-like isoform X1 [Schistocerca gregaria]